MHYPSTLFTDRMLDITGLLSSNSWAEIIPWRILFTLESSSAFSAFYSFTSFVLKVLDSAQCFGIAALSLSCCVSLISSNSSSIFTSTTLFSCFLFFSTSSSFFLSSSDSTSLIEWRIFWLIFSLSSYLIAEMTRSFLKTAFMYESKVRCFYSFDSFFSSSPWSCSVKSIISKSFLTLSLVSNFYG